LILLNAAFGKESSASDSLLHRLRPHCTLRVDGLHLFLSCKAFVLGALDSREDLLRALAANPLTTVVARDQYPGLARDIQDLVARDLVYAADADARTRTLFYLQPRWNIGAADPDIRALWHAAAEPAAKRRRAH
jgi:hypothetical protein